jgi:hypothetical protein
MIQNKDPLVMERRQRLSLLVKIMVEMATAAHHHNTVVVVVVVIIIISLDLKILLSFGGSFVVGSIGKW